MSKPDDWKCEACEGTGMAVPDCEECHGDGWVEDEEDGGTMTCPSCNGDKCDTCGGSGEKPSSPLPRPTCATPCEHDWKIWPETDGQSQRCMKCGKYRKTPTTGDAL